MQKPLLRILFIMILIVAGSIIVAESNRKKTILELCKEDIKKSSPKFFEKSIELKTNEIDIQKEIKGIPVTEMIFKGEMDSIFNLPKIFDKMEISEPEPDMNNNSWRIYLIKKNKRVDEIIFTFIDLPIRHSLDIKRRMMAYKGHTFKEQIEANGRAEELSKLEFLGMLDEMREEDIFLACLKESQKKLMGAKTDKEALFSYLSACFRNIEMSGTSDAVYVIKKEPYHIYYSFEPRNKSRACVFRIFKNLAYAAQVEVSEKNFKVGLAIATSIQRWTEEEKKMRRRWPRKKN